mgnify:CR=1 FL=1
MMNNLWILNISFDLTETAESFAHLHALIPENLFSMKTCQRILIMGNDSLSLQNLLNNPFFRKADYLKSTDAYLFLLEMLCGLKSKIIAETEIVSQFKQFYLEYLGRQKRNPSILRILEKLLKDTKEVRGQYLIGIGKRTYSGLAKKILTQTGKVGSEVLILGTGQLASEMAFLLNKKFDVSISGRNPIKQESLAQSFNLKTCPWDIHQEHHKYSSILCAISSDDIIYNESFFQQWHQHHNEEGIFIDFSGPSVISAKQHLLKLNLLKGIFYLDDLFEFGQENGKEAEEKIHKARQAIEEITLRRKNGLMRKNIKRLMAV